MTDRGLTALNAVLDFSKQQIAFAGILTSITFAFFSSRPFSESAFRASIPVTRFVSWGLLVLCLILLVLVVMGRSANRSENEDGGQRPTQRPRGRIRGPLLLIVCFVLGVILRYFPRWFSILDFEISIFATTSVSWGLLFLSVLLGLLGVLGQSARRLQEKEEPEQIVVNRSMTACGLSQMICLVLGVALLFLSVSTLAHRSGTANPPSTQTPATAGFR